MPYWQSSFILKYRWLAGRQASRQASRQSEFQLILIFISGILFREEKNAMVYIYFNCDASLTTVVVINHKFIYISISFIDTSASTVAYIAYFTTRISISLIKHWWPWKKNEFVCHTWNIYLCCSFNCFQSALNVFIKANDTIFNFSFNQWHI